MELTEQEKRLAKVLAKQLSDADHDDTTVVCQMFGIEHARDLKDISLGDLTIEAKMLMVRQEPNARSPSVSTIETTLRQGVKLAQWGVRMPDPWEQRLTALEREMEALTSEQSEAKP